MALCLIERCFRLVQSVWAHTPTLYVLDIRFNDSLCSSGLCYTHGKIPLGVYPICFYCEVNLGQQSAVDGKSACDGKKQ